MVYYGTGISRGVAAGPIYCYEPFVPAPPCPAHGGSVEEQRALYEAAKQTAHVELSRMCARLEANKAAIFEAHMDILDDEVMDEDILAGIEGEQWTAQWAVEQVYEHYRAVLGNAPDARIRERAADLSDVKLRLLRILQGAPARGLDSLERPVIVAAKELLPSDTAAMDRANVLGIVTEMGGATSHSAILARSWGIPAVLGTAKWQWWMPGLARWKRSLRPNGWLRHRPRAENGRGRWRKRLPGWKESLLQKTASK